MRNVVDSLVEERKWLNKEAYEKLMEMPYGVMKVKDYRNSIKLEKGLAGDVQPADITAINIARNIFKPEFKENPKLVCSDKTYELTADKFMIIKAVILSCFSCSPVISKAIWQAVQDWISGSQPRYSEADKTASLFHSTYFTAYNLLQQSLKLETICVDDAIGKMCGE